MIEVINSLISALGNAITAILLLLPESPFTYVYNLDAGWLNTINYFLPIKEFVGILEAYTISVALYYAIRIPLRWAKVAGE
jgi:hypothetical protein